jgi:peptide/nickel transport system substrate-binding protein
LIDRNYVAKEIYGGLAIPMWAPINPIFPDYANIADTMKGIQIKYGFDQKKGKELIDAEMKKLGAELTNNKWTYKGAPVTLIFLIRTEDERRQMGDYIAKQFEDIGFTVDRQYKTAAEASPLWLSSDPAEGKWTLYTGGWASTAISRDWSGNFDFYFTARSSQASSPLWKSYAPVSKDFDKLSTDLALGNFKDKAERTKMMAQAAELSMGEAFRLFMVNRISYYPHPSTASAGSDLAAGPFAPTFAFTLQLDGKAGGQAKIAQPSMLTQPWNVVAGSNFLYDNIINRATRNPHTMADPFTGLVWPQLVSTAELTVKTGTPIFKTLDWVTIKTADNIEVPKDAMSDWDAEKQQFITAAERFGDKGATAKVKAVITYDKDMFKTKWHDGSTLSQSDFMLSWILGFDRAKEKSAIYDASVAAAHKTFLTNFKGLKVVQKDPLVVEVYSDLTALDGELLASAFSTYYFPLYTQGNSPWHTIALGIQAETDKKLTFGQAKSTTLKVDWMNYISGPSLPILNDYLTKNVAKAYIPYEKVMSQYVTADEAANRNKNLAAFSKDRGHLWVQNGPFYLHSVKPTEKIVTIRKFADFADSADKWSRFAQAKISTAAVAGPSRVTVGQAAQFTVDVSFNKAPYPANEIDFVKFVVVDGKGNVAFSGEAKAGAKAGQYTVDLTAEQTTKLDAGSNRLEVIVASKVVAIPTSESLNFVTVK